MKASTISNDSKSHEIESEDTKIISDDENDPGSHQNLQKLKVKFV